MDRRHALAALTLGPWLPAPRGWPNLDRIDTPPADAARHTIDGVETFRVKVNARGDWVLLRTRTTSGLTGIGDCSQSGNDARSIALVHQYLQTLRGRSM